jgi:hypothetical protein
MILDEARIHDYTHTNHKLNVLNIKYYDFGSNFDIIEFAVKNVHVNTAAKHSTIQGQHLTIRCRPQKRSTLM